MQSVSTPTAVPGINDATALAVGGAHACVLRANDEVWCWGGGSPVTMPALATPGRVTLTRL
jgi:alpha-tubulin suppressor-like RCC1 family protein